MCYFLFKGRIAANALKVELKNLQFGYQQIKEKQGLLEMAEQIAQIGTWEVMLESEQVRWSDELYKLYGYANDFTPDL